MPKFLSLLLVSILFVSCNTEECDGFKNKFTPMWYETYFELLKPDGSSYENQEVKISSPRKFVNGNLVPSNPNYDEWQELYEVSDQDSIPKFKIFGLGCETCLYDNGLSYAGGPDECGYGYFENWNREIYYLIEFPEKQIDTLLIQDILEPGGNRSFKYYINGAETEILNFLYYPYLQIIH